MNERGSDNTNPHNSPQQKIPFIQIPRSIFSHYAFRELKCSYQMLFIKLISEVCFLPAKFYDHGITIELEVGQICCTIRQLASKTGMSKNDVERGLNKLIEIGFLRQEVRHVKSIISITESDTLTLMKMYSETGNETKMRQERDKSETQKDNIDNVDKEEKKRKNIKKEKPIQDEKIAVREWVALTQKEQSTLIETHGEELANEMLDKLDSFNTQRQKHYDSDYGALKRGGWVHKTVLAERAKFQTQQQRNNYANPKANISQRQYADYVAANGNPDEDPNILDFSRFTGN